jgi:two-component system sensor histidine kinase/response regulator
MNDHITKPVDPDIMFQTLLHWIKKDQQPMVNKTVFEQAQPEILRIPGVDTEAGLRRVVGNQKLYLSLLRQFCQGQCDVAARIGAALAEQDLASAGRIAHTAKGVAGNIGAKAIQEVAGQLETLIMENASQAMLRKALQQLDGTMATLIVHIKQTPGVVIAEPSVEATVFDREAFKLVLAKLADFLSDSDSDAIDCFDGVRDQFRIACSDADFTAFDKAIHEFEFSQALQQLMTIADNLR